MWKHKKTIQTVVILIVVLAAGALIIIRSGGNRPLPGMSRHAYFYDLNTGELFTAEADRIPPIDAPSGVLRGTQGDKAGVRAYVFTCGDNTESDRYIAWIETYTPEAQRAVAEQRKRPATSHPVAGPGVGFTPSRIARVNPESPGDVRWTGSDTPKGVDIVRSSTTPCADGSAPIPCVP